MSSLDMYEKTHLSDLVPLVAYLVPEMNEGVIQHYIRTALMIFARKTKCLRRTIEIETHNNTCDYYLEIGDDYKIHSIIDVKLNGCCLKLAGRCDCSNGDYHHSQGKITLCHPTCCTDCLEVEAVVIPSIQSCYIDADLADNYPDAVIEGFKQYAYSGNDERWKNMTESRIAQREFKRIIDEARADCMCSNTENKIVRLTS